MQLTYGHFLNMQAKTGCCGTPMPHAVKFGAEPTESDIQGAKERLLYWLNHRLGVHQCDLVTPENPLGRKDVAPA